MRDLTGQTLIMLEKKQYGKVDSDKRNELHLRINEWITAVYLKLAHEFRYVHRIGWHDMIENKDSELRRIPEDELKFKAWWTEWSDSQDCLVRKEVIEKW